MKTSSSCRVDCAFQAAKFYWERNLLHRWRDSQHISTSIPCTVGGTFDATTHQSNSSQSVMPGWHFQLPVSVPLLPHYKFIVQFTSKYCLRMQPWCYMKTIENQILGRKVDMKKLAIYRKENFDNCYYHILCLPCAISKPYYIACSQ